MAALIATALVVYSIFVGALFLFQRNMMYYPGHHLPTPAESGVAEMAVVRVTTEDGLELTSWYGRATAIKPTIVFFQGNAGTIAGRSFKVRRYLDAGYGVFLVGYRGYGGNPGKPMEQGLSADGRAALRYLENVGVPSAEWIFYGESLGSGVAVEMAHEWAQRIPVGAVILEAPFTSMGDAAAEHYPFVPARMLVRDRYASVEKVADIRAPLLIIHGEADRTVPKALGKRLFDAASEPKQAHWISGAGHNNLYDFGVTALVEQFITDVASD